METDRDWNGPERQMPPVALQTHEDDRGDLTEILHNHELANDRFGQVYVVRDPMPGTIRAFHGHHKLWDYFSIIQGKAMFWLVSTEISCLPPEGAACKSVPWPTLDGLRNAWAVRYVLGERPHKLLTVPPEVFHGWMSLAPNTILLSTGSEVYDSENPDEFRVSPDACDGLDWDWEVVMK